MAELLFAVANDESDRLRYISGEGAKELLSNRYLPEARRRLRRGHAQALRDVGAQRGTNRKKQVPRTHRPTTSPSAMISGVRTHGRTASMLAMVAL